MKIYGIFQGGIYNEGYFSRAAFKYKKDAVKHLRDNGCKYNRAQNLYIKYDNEGDDTQWYRIEEIDYYTNVEDIGEYDGCYFP